MKKNNDLVPANSNDSDFSFIPNGKGRFERGTDKRGNPFEKRTYDNGDFLKQELLHSGELKVTAKKKIK